MGTITPEPPRWLTRQQLALWWDVFNERIAILTAGDKRDPTELEMSIATKEADSATKDSNI
jgi:hypothetical protein